MKGTKDGQESRQTYLLGKIQKYIAGDMDAFSDIYNETYSDIKAVCYAKLAGQKEEAEDIVQNSFIRIADKMYTYDAEKGTFLTWARKVAANECNAELRKNRVKVTHIEDMKIDEEDDKAVEFEDDHLEFNPEAHYEKAEREQMISEIIGKIPEKQRECIILYCMEQMKEEEIADILGIPKGTVKSRIYNARKNIMAEVSQMEKRGISLFGMAPVVFFAWLLVSKKEAFAAEADAPAMCKLIEEHSQNAINGRSENIQKAVQHTAPKGGLGAAGKAAAGVSGKGVIAKVTAGIVAAAVIGTGGYTGYTKYQNAQTEKAAEQNKENDEKKAAKGTEESQKVKKEDGSPEAYIEDVLKMEKIKDKEYTTGVEVKPYEGDGSVNAVSLKEYPMDSGYFNMKEADLDQDGQDELLVIKNNGLTTVTSNFPDYVYDENGSVVIAVELQVYEKDEDGWKLADKTVEYLGEDHVLNHTSAIYLSEKNDLFVESYHLSAAYSEDGGWELKGYQYRDEKLQPIYFNDYWNSAEVAEKWNQELAGMPRNKSEDEERCINLAHTDFDEFPELKNALSRCMAQYGMDVSGWEGTDDTGEMTALYKKVPGITLLFSEEVKTEKSIEELEEIWTNADGLTTQDREGLSEQFGNVNITINTPEDN